MFKITCPRTDSQDNNNRAYVLSCGGFWGGEDCFLDEGFEAEHLSLNFGIIG